MQYDIPKPPKIEPKVMQPDQRRFCVVPLRAVLNDKVTRTELRVLCVLASYANKSGFSYVSQKRMAQDLHVTPQAISKHLISLEKKGIIKSFDGYSTNIKGKTKRIIYDDKISDREAEQIGGEPKEPFTNAEYNELLKLKRNKDLEETKQPDTVAHSELTDKDRIARLKILLADVRKSAEVDRMLAVGMSIAKIEARFKS